MTDLFIYKDIKTGRLLGQDGMHSQYCLFDLPGDSPNMRNLCYSVTREKAEEWLKWFLIEADPAIIGISPELHDDIINETCVLRVVRYHEETWSGVRNEHFQYLLKKHPGAMVRLTPEIGSDHVVIDIEDKVFRVSRYDLETKTPKEIFG